MRQLIVNADDFGLSAGITGGILLAHASGIVTSTSIVASGRYFDESVAILHEHPDLGVGVHLTLMEERPVAETALLPTLAPEGSFPPSYSALISGVLSGKIRKSEIELELRAQIDKCRRSGINPTHLDSHQHVHALPALFRIVLKLADACGIPAIRIPRDRPRPSELTRGFLPKTALCAIAHLDAALFARKTIYSTSHFAGLFESGALNEAALLRILGRVPHGTTELVCHPAQPDADSISRYAHWNYNWADELAALTSPTVRRFVQTRNIQLISYANISASG